MNMSLYAIIPMIGVAAFGLLIVLVAIRWRLKESGISAFSLYLAVALIWNISSAMHFLSVTSDPNLAALFQILTAFSQMMMPIVFGALTPAFLNKRLVFVWYLGIALLIVTAWWVITLNLNNSVAVALTYLPSLRQGSDVLFLLEVLGWVIATLFAPVIIVVSLRQRRQAQFHNRLRYWLGGVIILSVANILIFSQNPTLLGAGALINIVGSLFISTVIMRSHLPDLQMMTGRLISTVIVTISLSILLFATLYGAYLSNNEATNTQQAIIWLATAAIALAFLLPRLARWMDVTLTQMLFEHGGDDNSTIKAYSQNVSTEWDFNKLGQQALSFILQELQISNGILFFNEGDGFGHVTLTLVASTQTIQAEKGYFFADDPWVIRFRKFQEPVTQYDLDVLPAYRYMDGNSRHWLASLNMEIFFPVILRQRELVGVLALGTKRNNRPYHEKDIARINILASQIAIDLDKAKMFRQLGSVNQKMGDMLKKFETVDRGKTDFLSIASHELRTPLTHIHGYASMLMEATEEELQSVTYLQHIFNGISKGSNRLKDVVDLIFDVSKAEIGEMKLVLGPANLSSIVNEAAKTQAKAIQERRQDLIISGLDRLPMITCDGRRLTQAIEQLLNNAVKYTPDQGAITITGREIQEDTQSFVELTITDTGIGINPQDRTRIFDKFYRVGDVENHSTSSVKFKGAGPGLGLSLVAGIVKAHGGRVWVESPKYDEDECPGSQFHLILPVEAAQQPEPTLDASPDIPDSMAKTRHWRGDELEALKKRVAKQPE